MASIEVRIAAPMAGGDGGHGPSSASKASRSVVGGTASCAKPEKMTKPTFVSSSSPST